MITVAKSVARLYFTAVSLVVVGWLLIALFNAAETADARRCSKLAQLAKTSADTLLFVADYSFCERHVLGY